jgi:hypothetical protein
VINGESCECRVSRVLVDPHAVIEMGVWAVSDTKALLKHGACSGDLTGRPKQGAAQSRAFFDE